MFNENEMTYGYNDVSIQPAKISEIEHRSECVTKKNDYLPIFTAPMSTIINEKNYDIFDSNGIITILARNIDTQLETIMECYFQTIFHISKESYSCLAVLFEIQELSFACPAFLNLIFDVC